MKYFNYLNLDFETPAKKLKEYLVRENLIEDIGSAWRKLDLDAVIKEVPELVEMFRPLGLEIHMVAIFVTYYKVGVIHRDDDIRSCRINFPIMNCNDTVTNFYKVKNQSEQRIQTNGYKLHAFNSNDCELVDQMRLTQVAVMRVLEPHQVVSYNDNLPRVSCTVAFKQNIEYLLGN